MTDIAELEKKAWTGDYNAMEEVARAYRFGKGVEEDRAKAQEWHEKRFLILEYLAENGDIDAMDRVAHAYRFGKGVEESEEKAREWIAKFRSASEAQMAEIAREEAVKEKKEAEKRISLLKKRAEAGDAEAMLDLAVGYRHGRGIEIDLEKSRHWLKEWDRAVKKKKKGARG
ncbi:uncharacterized protein LOC132744379 [Ruditapes philippinarum]|uniref:uncharacterized protein LOC132744379 n=1 Tax=Ruditapes philippinarum TaxID=129788 RepID=UPI00295AF048|nr:uncharacterized protein LOC132744379 [Ruditapes philippinarum]